MASKAAMISFVAGLDPISPLQMREDIELVVADSARDLLAHEFQIHALAERRRDGGVS
jgi:hypothetical protein